MALTKIQTAAIAANAITAAKIADGTVIASDIADGSITEGKIAANAVTTAKIAAGAVSAGSLGTIYTANISDIGSSTVTFTNKTITGTKETRVAMGASDIDMSLGNYFTKTISGTTTLTVSNVPSSGTSGSFILDLTNGGSATVNWWSGVKWPAGTAPTLTASGRDVLGFFTHDGGTIWSGLVLGLDVK